MFVYLNIILYFTWLKHLCDINNKSVLNKDICCSNYVCTGSGCKQSCKRHDIIFSFALFPIVSSVQPSFKMSLNFPHIPNSKFPPNRIFGHHRETLLQIPGGDMHLLTNFILKLFRVPIETTSSMGHTQIFENFNCTYMYKVLDAQGNYALFGVKFEIPNLAQNLYYTT